MEKLNSKLILFFLFTFFYVEANAQDIYFSNYPQQQFFYNPAFAGVDSTHDFSLSGRKTKYDFSGFHYSALLSYNQPICHFKSGIGGSICYLSGLGFRNYTVTSSYNYKFKLAPKMNLRIGLSASTGFLHQDKYEDPFLPNRGYPAFNKTYFDLRIGVEYDWRNFFAGVSFKQYDFTRTIKHFSINFSPLIFTAGNKFRICKSISTTPSFIYCPELPYYQVANDVWFKKTFLLGCGIANGDLRFGTTTVLRGGVCLKKKITAVFYYVSGEKYVTNKYDGVNEEIFNYGFSTFLTSIQYRF